MWRNDKTMAARLFIVVAASALAFGCVGQLSPHGDLDASYAARGVHLYHAPAASILMIDDEPSLRALLAEIESDQTFRQQLQSDLAVRGHRSLNTFYATSSLEELQAKPQLVSYETIEAEDYQVLVGQDDIGLRNILNEHAQVVVAGKLLQLGTDNFLTADFDAVNYDGHSLASDDGADVTPNTTLPNDNTQGDIDSVTSNLIVYNRWATIKECKKEWKTPYLGFGLSRKRKIRGKLQYSSYNRRFILTLRTYYKPILSPFWKLKFVGSTTIDPDIVVKDQYNDYHSRLIWSEAETSSKPRYGYDPGDNWNMKFDVRALADLPGDMHISGTAKFSVKGNDEAMCSFSMI